MMQKIPIAGGPGTGKTTLINGLRDAFPEAHIVPEPAEIVISAELEESANNPDHVPVVPWLDYKKFAPKVVAMSVALEAEIPPESGLVFLDRSLIDTIAYCRIEGFESFIPTVIGKAATANYSRVFFCQRLDAYESTQVRHEGEEKARITHKLLDEAYQGSGLDIVRLPSVSVEQRIDIIASSL